MSINEIIEQAAMEYASKMRGLNHKKTAKFDFIEGVKYAQKTFVFHNANEEKPIEGVKVIARKRGRWINLAIYTNVAGSADKPDMRWVCGNSCANWEPDEWAYIPEI